MKSKEEDKNMSKDCKYFVQHAWKKDLCANCFKSREDHLKKTTFTKPYVVKDVKNIQGILREHHQGTKQEKKNRVKFPDDKLAEIIGYGGDDFLDINYESDLSSNDVEIVENNDNLDNKSKKENGKDEVDQDIDLRQDSEEDRALNNITRVNTNFNAVTANLTASATSTTTTNGEIKKPPVSLMLGKINKDSDGKKTTLLISVTPFGADDTIPTAKRPIERKRLADNKNIELEKIIDMPLIVSNNSVKKAESSSDNSDKKLELNKIPVSSSEIKEDKIIENLLKEEETKAIAADSDLALEDLGDRTVEGESLSIDSNNEESISTIITLDNNSREEAGVPDGEEDEKKVSNSFECTSIISTEPRYSFLHNVKPSVTKQITEQSESNETLDSLNSMENKKISTETTSIKINSSELITTVLKDDISSFENQSLGITKRRMAPKPPEINCDDVTVSLFARKQNFKSYLKSDCPVVREKEKRERASLSYSPKLKKSIDTYQSTEEISNNFNSPDEEYSAAAMPVSRISTNTSYSLPAIVSPSPSATTTSSSLSTVGLDKCCEEKKKSKSRFLPFKKFLRMGGSRKDLNLVTTRSFSTTKVDDISSGLSPKPRLEIIHPLELDGAAVEVLRHDKMVKTNDEIIHGDSKHDMTHNVTARLGKPPPPPRNGQSSSATNTVDSQHKMNKTTAELLSPNLNNMTKSSMRGWQHSSAVAGDSIYANLAEENVAGDMRCGIAPLKPQRTSSMRRDNDTSNDNNQSSPRCIKSTQNYDIPPNTDSLDSASSECHDAYELLSSSPECDSNLELCRQKHIEPLRGNIVMKRNSEGGVSNAGYYRQYKCNKPLFVRSNSLPYCGSETESELGNEMEDWKEKNDEYTMDKIHQHRNQSVVYRSLEDNYGAVIIANHESLAQMLERLSQTDQWIPSNLRNLNTTNLRLQNFVIDIDTILTIGKRIFCSACLNDNAVTLCLSFDGLSSSVLSHKEFCLMPITEFMDKITNELPSNYLSSLEIKNSNMTVSVLPPMKISPIKSFLSILSRDHHQYHQNNENLNRECYLVLLQFINALKNLQARGIEELPMNLGNFLLGRDERDTSYRLYHLQCLHNEEREKQISLCQSALVALKELNLFDKLPIIRHLLMRERAVTLSQVKAVLEYSLWGPSDVTMDVWKEREIVLQRWLDLERARTILRHSLVRTRLQLSIIDEYQLIFLVNTTAKNMCEASVLLLQKQS